MDAKACLDQVSYLFPKHIRTQTVFVADHDPSEPPDEYFTFFNVLTVDPAAWQEFLEDTFDFFEFQSQLFEDEAWDTSKTIPIATVGTVFNDFDPSAEPSDDDGQIHGILVVDLSGDTVESCPIYLHHISGTATDDEPDKLTIGIKQLFDSKID